MKGDGDIICIDEGEPGSRLIAFAMSSDEAADDRGDGTADPVDM